MNEPVQSLWIGRKLSTMERLSIASFLFENRLAVHRAAAGISVRAIRGASHWLMMDQPEEFNRELDAFLAQVY